MSHSSPIMILLITPAILAVVGCSVERTQQDQPATVTTVAPRTYPVVSKPETPLVLDVKISGDPASPVISGETNLPDGTRMNANAAQGDRYMADGADMTVEAGRFASGPLRLNGDPLTPGKYRIEISTPLEAVQPDGVRQLVGTAYENLTGPGLIEGSYGRTIEISRSHVVAGARDTQAVQDRASKRMAVVRDMFEQSCAEKQQRQGLPTLTPKAKATIAACVSALESHM